MCGEVVGGTGITKDSANDSNVREWFGVGLNGKGVGEEEGYNERKEKKDYFKVHGGIWECVLREGSQRERERDYRW